MSVDFHLVLSRVSKTFREGDPVSGFLRIESKSELKHEGVVVSLQGKLTIQSMSVTGLSASPGNVISLIDNLVQVVSPGKIPAGTTEIPFHLNLEVDGNNNRNKMDGFKLFETYHGVKVNVEYFIGAEIRRSGIIASSIAANDQELYVEWPPSESPKKGVDEKFEFVMTPETVRKRKNRSKAKSESPTSSIADFRVRGHLSSTTLRLSEPLAGVLVVEQSERPIKSLELQLLRRESIGSGYFGGSPDVHETSEVQNIQIGLGNVARNLEIPIYMIFPRYFVCPTTDTNIFGLGFELNVNVIFNDNFVASENVPLKLIR